MRLTEKNRHKVCFLDDFRQNLGINFFDAIRPIHRFQACEKIQYIFFVHQVT